MDFEDTPEEAEFRRKAHEWLAANARVRQGAPEAFDEDELSSLEASKAWQALKADAGWACLGWPKEYGGQGATPVQSLIWTQEQDKFHVPPNVFHIGHAQAGPTIIRYGTAEQKAQWLPGMIRGEHVWCQLFSEPDAGSDLAAVRTRARLDSDGTWRVNGQKTWTSGAQVADWAILLARTDPNVPKHQGLTYFVVDMKAPGIEVRPVKQIWDDSDFCEVFLNDVPVPDEHRIGPVGSGWSVAMTTLNFERGAVSASTPGPAGEKLPCADDLLSLAKNVVADATSRGAPRDAALEQKIADLYVTWKGLEFTAYRMMTAIHHGEEPGGESVIGKLIEGRLQQQAGALALDLLVEGGHLADEKQLAAFRRWEHSYLVAPAIRIAGGTDEIMKNIIAERILGLPPEPRTDKNLAFSELKSAIR
ncbi:acyl-CoA dehydrogenase family protein [Pseudohaliea sp.]|uniref:acyl-CoA dehydrogenase family protein n=1 Tax=Pseudohaliea sp. TaxID=2740289 RepID=UPI0032ED81FD